MTRGAALDNSIAYIFLDFRIAVLEDAQELPIETLLDENGDRCDVERARGIVAGPDKDGRWWGAVLSDFDPVEFH